jgi:hypothetical protein
MPKNNSQPPIEHQNNSGTVTRVVSFRAEREISVSQCERFLGAILRLRGKKTSLRSGCASK